MATLSFCVLSSNSNTFAFWSGLNVGDKVKLENGCIPTLIQMPGDTQTLAAKQKVHREGKSVIGVGTVKFSEFLLVDEYSIVGVWIESPAVNN